MKRLGGLRSLGTLTLVAALALSSACAEEDGGDGDNGGGGGNMTASGLVAGGSLMTLPGYEAAMARGAALIARTQSGTQLSLQVSGLTPMTAYPAHLHALPCAMAGGGHYKIDPAVVDTAEANEIWLGFTTNAEGQALAVVNSPHLTRADGMSIVIHDPSADNAKMLCADLGTTGFSVSAASGQFAPFAAAEAMDQSIGGSAMLARSAMGTMVMFSASGLVGGQQYVAHVHALPCAVTEAGGHYKLDPTIEASEQGNELWPAIALDAMGNATGMLQSPHVARADAQSVVIHRQTAAGAPKVACADLAPSNAQAFQTAGLLLPLPTAMMRGLQLSGSAMMSRNLDGSTTVSVQVGGLAANTEYPIHVHDRPCNVGDGGGHYKVDTAATEAAEANEMWLTATTGADGSAMRQISVQHLARADAQAVVVHAPDGERLACIDLAPI